MGEADARLAPHRLEECRDRCIGEDRVAVEKQEPRPAGDTHRLIVRPRKTHVLGVSQEANDREFTTDHVGTGIGRGVVDDDHLVRDV